MTRRPQPGQPLPGREVTVPQTSVHSRYAVSYHDGVASPVPVPVKQVYAVRSPYAGDESQWPQRAVAVAEQRAQSASRIKGCHYVQVSVAVQIISGHADHPTSVPVAPRLFERAVAHAQGDALSRPS